MGEPTSRSIFSDSRGHFGNNAPSLDNNRPDSLTKIQHICAQNRRNAASYGMALLAVASLAACQTGADEQAAVAQGEEPVLECGDDGRLSAEIYGAIRASLDWHRNDVECEGMPRPDGSGVRLRFGGEAGAGEWPIAVIIAMPDFTRDTTKTEFSANVTLIQEGSGRFFSTSDLDNCLCEIAAVRPLDDSGKRVGVSGALYCVSPLPEVNGGSSISVPELLFTGLLDWGAS